MIRIGLVGAGKIVDTFHLPAWKKLKEVEVVSICDPRREIASELAQRFCIPNVFSNIEEMLAYGGLDAVDICSPHKMHVYQACVALNSGLHCLIEKPFATTHDEAKKIAETSKNNDRIVMCAQHQRFRTESILLKSKIDMGELGKVYATRVEAMATRGIPKQVNNSYTDVKNSGGGPLMDQGAHGLDIAWWFMGCPDPISAFAVTSDKAAPQKNSTMGGVNWDIYNVEDFATGIVRFTDDRSISIQTSYFSHCSEDKFECEVFGTRGGIIWPRLIFTESQSDTIRRKKILVHELEQASVAEMKHFVSLIDGNSEPIVPVSESVKLISIIEGLYRSAETGNMVKF